MVEEWQAGPRRRPCQHRRDAVTGIVTYEEWCKDGQPDRADGPAVIMRDLITGTVTCEEWYKDGKWTAPTVRPTSCVTGSQAPSPMRNGGRTASKFRRTTDEFFEQQVCRRPGPDRARRCDRHRHPRGSGSPTTSWIGPTALPSSGATPRPASSPTRHGARTVNLTAPTARPSSGATGSLAPSPMRNGGRTASKFR